MPPVIDMPRLQEIRKRLKALPKVEKVRTFSGPEALEALKEDIRALSRKGYGSKEIAMILKQEGLAASSAKVKKILADGGPVNNDNNEAAGNLSASSSAPVSQRTAQPKTNGKEAQQ
ncbi:hypothetical protein LJB86_03095 [Deltaproteobacteria bacterium OttesenSCG-928-M10]|nr:hypothetical protein [Deltaproteobacteria bacterium OttesenSCG-928-M10]